MLRVLISKKPLIQTNIQTYILSFCLKYSPHGLIWSARGKILKTPAIKSKKDINQSKNCKDKNVLILESCWPWLNYGQTCLIKLWSQFTFLFYSNIKHEDVVPYFLTCWEMMFCLRDISSDNFVLSNINCCYLSQTLSHLSYQSLKTKKGDLYFLQ